MSTFYKKLDCCNPYVSNNKKYYTIEDFTQSYNDEDESYSEHVPIRIASLNVCKALSHDIFISSGFEDLLTINRSVFLTKCHAINSILYVEGVIEEKVIYSNTLLDSCLSLPNVYISSSDYCTQHCKIPFDFSIPIPLDSCHYIPDELIEGILDEFHFYDHINLKTLYNTTILKYDTIHEILEVILTISLIQNKSPSLLLSSLPPVVSPPIIEPIPNINIKSFVWNDLNGNGIKDADEPGIENIIVNLLNNYGDVISSTKTSTTGLYSFTTIPGNYFIEFLLPNDYKFTKSNVGSNISNNSNVDELTGKTPILAFTSNISNLNVGMYKQCSISGTIFLNKYQQLNNTRNNYSSYINKKYSSQKSPDLSKIIINLWKDDIGIGEPFKKTSPSSTGSYYFNDLPPGNYYVDIILVKSNYIILLNNYNKFNKYGLSNEIVLNSGDEIKNTDAIITTKKRNSFYNTFPTDY